MIRVAKAVKVLKCEEKKFEQRVYYRLNVIDEEGDIYVISSQKFAKKDDIIGLEILSSQNEKSQFRAKVVGWIE